MIKLYKRNLTTTYVAASAVMQVTVADTSSQWHGTKALVKLFDGEVLEVSNTADSIVKAVEAELQKEKAPLPIPAAPQPL